MASVAAFRRTLQRMAESSRREPAEVVKQAYIKFVVSGRANTKLGKANRQVVANPDYDAKRRRGYRLHILAYRPDGTINRIPTNSRTDVRRRIRRRGLAKQSWSWMLAGISAPRGSDPLKDRRGISASGIVSVLQNLGRHARPSVEYANSLRYLEVANPGVHSIALRKASNSMEGMLARNIRSKYERIWRAGR